MIATLLFLGLFSGSFATAQTPVALGKSATPKEVLKVTKGYSNLFDKGIESISCDGITEVKSVTSTQAAFKFKISRDKDDEQSTCDVQFDAENKDKDMESVIKFTKLLPDFCKTFKAFYFDSPAVMLKNYPVKTEKLTYQDLEKSSRLVLDKKFESIQIFHNGTDDIEVNYKKIRKWNVPNRFVFNPSMAGESSKAITDVKYHVIRGVPTPQLFDTFIQDQRGHSFNSTFTLSKCKVKKF